MTTNESMMKSYDQLGYSPSQVRQMIEASNMPSGFVLFAGMAGSGRAATLKTFAETHPGNGAMVIVGEIRDSAAANAGRRIVEAGRMALGTVHAHFISGILPRLTNDEVGMSRDVLTNPNMLTMLAYQALVPKVCKHCSVGIVEALRQAEEEDKKSPDTSSGAVHLAGIRNSIKERFDLDEGLLKFNNIGGCSACNGRGTNGVTVVAEMILPDRKWLDLSRDHQDYEAAMYYRSGSDGRFDSPDMTGKTIFEHTLFKGLMGEVDIRNCERFDTFKRFEVRPTFTRSAEK